MNPDSIVFEGGACKALDDQGKVGGYLVRFGAPDATDASPSRDFFTKDTDFGLNVTTRSKVLYAHGLDGSIGNRELAVGSLKMDSTGIWLEAQLALRDEYEKKIFQMAKDGKLGLSSGTASHLIRREAQPNGSNKVVAWPLGLDASLTPTPAEPRAQAIALKSLHPPQVKGIHLGERAEPAAIMAAHRTLGEHLASELWDRLGDQRSAPSRRISEIADAHEEFRSLSMTMCKSLLMGPARGVDDSPGDRPGGGSTKRAPTMDDLEAIRASLVMLDAQLAGVFD